MFTGFAYVAIVQYRRIIDILSFMVCMCHDKKDEGLALLPIYILISLPIEQLALYMN